MTETITGSPALPAGTTRTYINGGLDKVLWSIDSAGPDPTKFWNTDLNGSVFALTNSAGSVIERQRYDAYGNAQITDASGTVIPGSTIGNQTGFQGRGHLPQFGMSPFRNRWYMPQTGTFASRDPLGMIDGPAVYAGFGGNPVGNVDPMGLELIISGKPWTVDDIPPEVTGALRSLLSRMIASDKPFSFPARDFRILTVPKVVATIEAQLNPPPAPAPAPVPPPAPKLGLLARAGGALQAFSGSVQTFVFAPAIAGMSFGLATPVALAVGFHGMDDMRAGTITAVTGEPTQTLTARAITAVAGPYVGTMGDALMGMAGPASMIRWASSIPALERTAAQKLLAPVAARGVPSATANQQRITGWTQHIEQTVEQMAAKGRSKVFVLGEGGQGRIIRFVHREATAIKEGWTEFVEMRPQSLNYSAADRAGTMTKAMLDETLQYNVKLVQELHRRGFQFKVIGVPNAAATSSPWLKAELEALEALGAKIDVIPLDYAEKVINMPKP